MQVKRKIKAILSLTTLLLTTNASAVMSNPFGWYFDVNAGYTKLLDINLNGGSTSTNGIGWNIDLGYKFMPYFGMEAGYTGYANSKVSDQYSANAGTLQSYSYDLSLKGIMPVYDSGMEIMAKVGVQRGHTKFSINNLAAAENINMDTRNSSHTGIYLVFGGEYYFIPELAIVGQWARAVGNSSVGTLDLYSLGLTFTFG